MTAGVRHVALTPVRPETGPVMYVCVSGRDKDPEAEESAAAGLRRLHLLLLRQERLWH